MSLDGCILGPHVFIYFNRAQYYQTLHEGLRQAFMLNKIPVCINRIGSMISVHFSERTVGDFASAATADNERFKNLLC